MAANDPPSAAPAVNSKAAVARWRLVLGKYAQDKLSGGGLSAEQMRMEQALDYLYSREYRGRGVRGQDGGDDEKGKGGSLDPSQISIPHWLSEVRNLFPKETVERIEKHALERYGMTELVTDEETLKKLEPSMGLLKILLSFRGQLKGKVLEEARRVIRKVVEELRRKLETDIRNKLTGRVNRFRHSNMKSAQNLDWRGTIRRNLKNYDVKRKQLIVDDVRFFSRVERHLPWTVILCVDQSGSMTDSVIYSAVMAGILTALPMIRIKLVVFDTSIVDLSDHADDPVEVLMSVQLGGGTDIGSAVRYCEKLIETPHRTVLVLVSDFEEGANPQNLLATIRRLAEAKVRLIGLAALDMEANPSYDRRMAEKLAGLGMDIAALTPNQLADWLAKVIR
jgi:Mg-chelatase subunit ChlD